MSVIDDENFIDDPSDQRPSVPMGLRWDGTVTAGHVLTSMALGVSLLIWGVRLEGRVTKEEDLRTGLEQRLDRYSEQQRQNDSDIQTGLRHLDDKITTLLMANGLHQSARER